MKKLYRSKENRIMFGVVGGLGEYFNVDPTVFRLLFIFFGIFTGVFPMILTYILALLVVPKHSKHDK